LYTEKAGDTVHFPPTLHKEAIMEFKVMAIKSLEKREQNKEVIRHDRFEAMRDARAWSAEGFDVVITNDDGHVLYTNTPHVEYLFEGPIELALKPISRYCPSFIDASGDIGNLFEVNLDDPKHLESAITQLIKLEKKGRDHEQVPRYVDPEFIRWRLLTGYLQTLGYPAGTILELAYPAELEDWLNAVFYYPQEDLQYVFFQNGIVTVN
jgi:hypothetical protein